MKPKRLPRASEAMRHAARRAPRASTARGHQGRSASWWLTPCGSESSCPRAKDRSYTLGNHVLRLLFHVQTSSPGGETFREPNMRAARGSNDCRANHNSKAGLHSLSLCAIFCSNHLDSTVARNRATAISSLCDPPQPAQEKGVNPPASSDSNGLKNHRNGLEMIRNR